MKSVQDILMKAQGDNMKPFEYVETKGDEKIYLNDKYQVNVKELPDGWQWLSIKRQDKEVIHDWRDLQEIKNLLCDKEREAVELYPAESRLVDTSNQFHLFVMPVGEKFPFGYGDRMIVQGHKGGWHKGSQQREFDDGNVPQDAMTLDEAKKLEKKVEEEV